MGGVEPVQAWPIECVFTIAWKHHTQALETLHQCCMSESARLIALTLHELVL